LTRHPTVPGTGPATTARARHGPIRPRRPLPRRTGNKAMGSRALFHITDGHRSGYYWLHWGSPAYQIPNLATFLHHCRTGAITPAVEISEDLPRTFTDGQLPTEKAPATWWTNRKSTDAENRYQLNLDSDQPVRLHVEVIRWLPGPPQWNTVCQTTGDNQLYQA